MNWTKPWIDVVDVNRGCVWRPVCIFPKVTNGPGQQAKYPAYPLKVHQRGGFARERVENFWVKRVRPAERFDNFRLNEP
jgi:hypothetical protein